ncbi:hypothetical protein C2S51_029764 [Perilla frutescens var. frutescens]|nr:hypothetical protein C2S51_029764 [Perilla frutescens var. frutescens]
MQRKLDFDYGFDLSIKSRVMELVRINPEFTAIDFSCNNFKGEIPDGIGDLIALYLLNFSGNGLLGSIPTSIGKLSNLELLDLSRNELTGMLPVELAKLTFLSYLNVSYNKLVGMIPTEPQLQTFYESSFEENLGLCGVPTKIRFGHHTWPPKEGLDVEGSNEEEIEWDYVLASLGFAVGLGVILWASMCNRTFIRVSRRVDVALEDFFDGRARRRRVVVRQISLRNRIAHAAVA